jgi:hypothetical protein
MPDSQLVLATIAQGYSFERRYDELDLSAAVTLQPKGAVEMIPRER